MEKRIVENLKKHLIHELEHTVHYKFIYDSRLVGTTESRKDFFDDFARRFNSKFLTNITGT